MIPNLTRMVSEVPLRKQPIPAGWCDEGSMRFDDGVLIATCYFQKTLGLAVLLSLSTMEDGSRFVHCSLARRSKLPSWQDVKIVKNAFLGEEVEAFHVLPKQSDYININPYCLHLWMPYEEATCDD